MTKDAQPVDFDDLLQRMGRVVGREVMRFEGLRGGLKTGDAQALQGYMRVTLAVVQDQREVDDGELDGMTDEEIAAREAEILAKKGKKR